MSMDKYKRLDESSGQSIATHSTTPATAEGPGDPFVSKACSICGDEVKTMWYNVSIS